MKTACMLALVFVLVLGVGRSLSWADDLPKNVDFETLITFPLAIEGLTGDRDGNLYTTERGGPPCNIHRINFATEIDTVVGHISDNPCSPSGLAFDANKDLLIADSGKIFKLTPNVSNPTAVVYAQNVPGANGIAVDKDGSVWTGDGTTGQGRVWKITGASPADPADCNPLNLLHCVEVFRIQPMATTSVELGPTFGTNAVGRDARTLPPGTIDAGRNDNNNLPSGVSQPLVANGLAFNQKGDLFNADTARGAIWKIEFNHDGTLKSRTDCDPVFTANTLCLENIHVAHPLLEGTDGIALDNKGNIWNSANERNAIVVVTEDKKVVEVFRNDPDATTHLRNTGPLEFPTSPFLLGKKFCTANSDGNRRDNSPNTAGEIAPAGPFRGKISCMVNKDQPEIFIDLKIPGLALPVK